MVLLRGGRTVVHHPTGSTSHRRRRCRRIVGRARSARIAPCSRTGMATFDGPARAVRCALAIAEAVRPLGLEIRAGVHTGEVEQIDAKIGGMAVVLGARIGAMADASEVLASSTVKDPTAGSGLVFEDRGEHALKKRARPLAPLPRARPVREPPTRYATHAFGGARQVGALRGDPGRRVKGAFSPIGRLTSRFPWAVLPGPYSRKSSGYVPTPGGSGGGHPTGSW